MVKLLLSLLVSFFLFKTVHCNSCNELVIQYTDTSKLPQDSESMHLDIKLDSIIKKPVNLSSFTKLKLINFHIEDNRKTKDDLYWEKLEDYLILPKNLENLSISFSDSESFLHLKNFDFSDFKNLESLEINGANIESIESKNLPAKIKSLSVNNAQKLNYIDLTDCEYLKSLNADYAIFSAIKLPQSIEILSLKGCKNIKNLDLEKYKILEILDLSESGIENLTLPQSIYYLHINNVNSLKKLDLSKFDIFTLSLENTKIADFKMPKTVKFKHF
jgi:hypothetical protein